MGIHHMSMPWAFSRPIDMTTKTIRVWARESGIEIALNGRITADVRMRYAEAMEAKR